LFIFVPAFFILSNGLVAFRQLNIKLTAS